MIRRLLLALVLLAVLPELSAQAPYDTADFGRVVQPFFKQWCASCHGHQKQKAQLNLEAFDALKPSAENQAMLAEIRERLANGQMPPETAPRPDAATRAPTLAWLEAALVEAQKKPVPLDAGRVTMRRLSRTEYTNTVRDLLGVETRAADAFPADNLGYGFDNIGDALSFSLIHIEKFLSAAESIAAAAISTEDVRNPEARRLEAEFMEPSKNGVDVGSDAANFFSRGRITQKVKLPRDGDYVLKLRVWGDQAGDEPARLGLAVNDARVEIFDVPEVRSAPAIREKTLRLAGGEQTIAVDFVNDFWDPENPKREARDRNLHVDYVEVVGPVDEREKPAGHLLIFAKDPGKGPFDLRSKPLVEALLLRAWRRPPLAAEVKRLTELAKTAGDLGLTFEESMRGVLTAALTSPHFLFRAEPGDAQGGAATKDLGDYALASRLSYFLWASMPDERLFELAKKGELRKPDILAAETRRLLRHERSESLATNFAALWLELKNLADATPDPERFPGFSKELAADMRRETELFFLECLRAGRSVYDLIDPKDTYLNERLAKHYGIPGVVGPDFRRVDLPDRRRGGLIGQASVHVLTSNPTRTSPVKRGKWVLENILDAATPAPPPGVDNLPEAEAAKSAATLREKLETHRRNPECASCHARLDPLGFALENYDAVGRWRTDDGGVPVDASGEWTGGRKVSGPEELKVLLKEDASFIRCLAKKLFIYAVGRDVLAADKIALDRMVALLPKEKTTIEDVIQGVVKLDAFRKRRG